MAVVWYKKPGGRPDLSTCDSIQHALIAGELSDVVAPHLQVCSDCTLLVEALQQLRPTCDAPTQVEVQPRAVLQAMVDGLVDGKRLLGRYQIQHRLGAGGEGWVYAALDTETKQRVAIKFGASDALPGFVNAQAVVHESVCPVHYTTVVGGVRIVVMRFVAGGSLADRAGQLGLAEALAVMRGVCAGLASVHAAGLVHLDIKPANILMDGGRPLIVDFGLSARSGTTCIGGRGTHGFMAPEQRAGQAVTPAADVFALGRLFRTLLRDPPPQRVASVLRRANAASPAERPANAAVFWAQLLAASRRRRAPWLLAALVLPVLAGGVWVTRPVAGARATWEPDLWGMDTVPHTHWNLALNRHGVGEPFIEASQPAVGCARNLGELIDGITVYQDLQHGYAFAGAAATCVPLGVLQDCGALMPDGPRCLLDAQEVQPVDRTSRPSAASTDPVALGQYHPGATCAEDVALSVTLPDRRPISAIRGWFRAGVPERLRVELETEDGIWRTVFATRENRQWIGERRRLPAEGVGSVPVTVHFTPMEARKLRLVLRCVPPEAGAAGQQVAEPVWLYELEVFAPLGRLEAWSRRWALRK